MPLTLRVTSFQKGALGRGCEKSFAEKGGTIGRVKDNDWVLPDPERIISSRHAVVQFKNGSYTITDTSANGTYLNGAKEPLGNGNHAPLEDGDRVVIGDYEIAVEIGGSAMPGLDIPAAGAGGFDDGFDDAFASPSPASGDSDEGLDPLALLGGGGGAGAGAGPSIPDSVWDETVDDLAPAGASVADDLPSPAQAFTPPAAHAEHIPEDWGDDLMPSSGAPARAAPSPPAPVEPPPPLPPAPPPEDLQDAETEFAPPARPAAAPITSPMMMEPEPVPAPAPAPAAPPVRAATSASSAGALAAFLKGAGLQPDAVPPEQAEEFMELIGEMFRESVQDLRDVLMARASLKSGFRMELTMIRPAENNPLKFAAGGGDEAMQNLLFRKGSSYLPPRRAMREGFQDIKDHQVAMMAGMQAAFRALLERFEPGRLEKRFDKAGGWSLLDLQKKSDYWSKFVEEYAEVKEQAEEDFQNLFGSDFSRAYEGQMRSLSKARKKQDS